MACIVGLPELLSVQLKWKTKELSLAKDLKQHKRINKLVTLITLENDLQEHKESSSRPLRLVRIFLRFGILGCLLLLRFVILSCVLLLLLQVPISQENGFPFVILVRNENYTHQLTCLMYL